MPSPSGGGDEDGDGQGERERVDKVRTTDHALVRNAWRFNLPPPGGHWTTGGRSGKYKFG